MAKNISKDINEIEESEKRYVSISLLEIRPQEELPADVFLFMAGKFIKLRKAGDPFGEEKYVQCLAKNITHVFVEMELLGKIIVWNETSTKKEITEQHKEIEQADFFKTDLRVKGDHFFQMKEALKKQVFHIFSSKVTEEEFNKLEAQSKKFCMAMSKQSIPYLDIFKSVGGGQGIIEHSVNVGLLSVYVGIYLGYRQQKGLENLLLGALLHDIGKTQIDMEKIDPLLQEEEMKNHPQLGVELIEKFKVSLPVKKIILEHHEQFNGQGYPRQIPGRRIYEFSKIVSMVNTYDNLIFKMKGNFGERKKQALDQLREMSGIYFDPNVCAKIIKALEFHLKK